MPGEKLSCVGCHEPAGAVPLNLRSMAMARPPSEITPWYGPARGFSFPREVQPVLEKYCVGCHNGKSREDGLTIPNFADASPGQRNFTNSYIALHPYVRRPGPESDYHLQKPGEWHADTSELIQMLQKGHKGVKLSTEAWDRLITWIDLNVPDHGTWSEHRAIASNFLERRLHMRTTYANRPENPEAIWQSERPPIQPVAPSPLAERKSQKVTAEGWPFDATEAARRQAAVGRPATMQIPLDENVTMELRLVPAGEFVMGDASGDDDECTLSRVTVDEPFYMGGVEVTNEQYALFDPSHDSAVISQTNKDCNTPGYPVNGPRQPVIRITWKQAMDFCDWLSMKTGRRFTLPTEAQWEWACRAGTATAFSFGDLTDDFARHANLADQALAEMARKNSPKWHPRDDRFFDKAMVTANAGSYAANAWGLKDMHGNVAEWTRSVYLPYQYREGRNERTATGKRVVRGGSWYDRPPRARSGFRLAYQPWMPVYNVGFRVICPANTEGRPVVVRMEDSGQ
jgi:formylglycine-generating enzyme required for sulfatase activity